MDATFERLVEVEQRAKSNTKRLDNLEDTNVRLERLIVQLEYNTDQLKNTNKRLDTLEKRPSSHWDKVIHAVIAAVVSAIVGGGMAMIIR